MIVPVKTLGSLLVLLKIHRASRLEIFPSFWFYNFDLESCSYQFVVEHECIVISSLLLTFLTKKIMFAIALLFVQ